MQEGGENELTKQMYWRHSPSMLMKQSNVEHSEVQV